MARDLRGRGPGGEALRGHRRVTDARPGLGGHLGELQRGI